jgi:hypothetical protein
MSSSANVPGAGDHNQTLIARFRERNPHHCGTQRYRGAYRWRD